MPRFWVLMCLLTFAGCVPESSPLYDLEPTPKPQPTEPDWFDAQTSGSIHGTVTWSGDLPVAPLLKAYPAIQDQSRVRWLPNPNLPKIDPSTNGTAGAIVFLRGVDPRRAKPWDHPPVRIEMDDDSIRVIQGVETVHAGIARRGDTLEMVSMKARFQSLRARGAEFFALAFPDANRPLKRTVAHHGLTELSSAAHLYWQRAYLFADDHPYYARTDAQGRFTINQVPDGRYEVVCWLPNWNEADRERDPETCQVARIIYRKPVECSTMITVRSGASVPVNWSISIADFDALPR